MALLPPEPLQTTKVIHSRWLFKGVMVHEKKANAGHRLIKIHPVQQELPEFRPVYRQASCIKVDPSISTTSMSFFFFLAIAVSNDHCFPAVGKTPCWQNTIALHVDGGGIEEFSILQPVACLRQVIHCVRFFPATLGYRKEICTTVLTGESLLTSSCLLPGTLGYNRLPNPLTIITSVFCSR